MHDHAIWYAVGGCMSSFGSLPHWLTGGIMLGAHRNLSDVHKSHGNKSKHPAGSTASARPSMWPIDRINQHILLEGVLYLLYSVAINLSSQAKRQGAKPKSKALQELILQLIKALASACFHTQQQARNNNAFLLQESCSRCCQNTISIHFWQNATIVCSQWKHTQ